MLLWGLELGWGKKRKEKKERKKKKERKTDRQTHSRGSCYLHWASPFARALELPAQVPLSVG